MNKEKDGGQPVASQGMKALTRRLVDLVTPKNTLFEELIRESSRIRISRGMGNHFKERINEEKNL